MLWFNTVFCFEFLFASFFSFLFHSLLCAIDRAKRERKTIENTGRMLSFSLLISIYVFIKTHMNNVFHFQTCFTRFVRRHNARHNTPKLQCIGSSSWFASVENKNIFIIHRISKSENM